MLISEAKPGDIVRLAVESLRDPQNGYKVQVPITGTVLARPGFPWQHCYAIGWTTEQNLQRQNEINYIREMSDPSFPYLTLGVYVMPETQCEVLTPPAIEPIETKVNEAMKKKEYKTLGEMKVGDRVRIPLVNRGFTVDSTNLSKEFLTVTVCSPATGGGAVIAWTDAEQKKKNASTGGPLKSYSYLLDVESQKKFVESGKLTRGYHINYSVPCTLISGGVAKPKSVGLMLTMIGMGAGLSRLSTRGTKSTLREIVAKS